jgi:ubiquinone/menaquinone biosynthesis C-methylase UbiE
LDVGCGDGRIDSLIARDRPELMITGLDVLARPNASIPVATFDGRHLPLPDAGVDVVMFVDVLHHAEEPFELLAEARRVARNGILIKDHLCETRSNARILGLMDWVGNFGHGVALQLLVERRVENRPR